MIWVRKSQHELAEQRHSGLSRAFSWLLFQTCFFGVACFIILQAVNNLQTTLWWIQPMTIISITGFAGGIVGSLIAFSLLSASDNAETEE